MDMSELQRHATGRGTLRRDEPMSRHTSWRAGGCARAAYFPVDADDLAAFLGARPAGETVMLVGLGSNLLVRDGGLDATVIFTHPALRDLAVESDTPQLLRIRAGAGVASPKLARFAANHGGHGAEFLAGIPGTVGGALAMNAGCYGGETWRLVSAVRTVDRHGVLHQRAPADYAVGYRSVRPLGDAAEWFLGAWFDLPRGEPAPARERIRDLLARRVASQPLNLPNAGSVFRNPQGDHAARLIEAAGLKGVRRGGAQISERHANFIVNRGGASAADIEALIDLAEAQVAQRFGVRLQREVHIVGEA